MLEKKKKGRVITASALIVLFLLILGVIFFVRFRSDDRITSYGLTVDDLTVSREKDGAAVRPRIFHPGDDIHIRFLISDFELDSQGILWIQEDLVMSDPAGTPVLERPNLLDDRVPAPEGKARVPVNNTITLFDTAQPGNYTVQINVRDKIGGGAVYIETGLTVEPR